MSGKSKFERNVKIKLGRKKKEKRKNSYET